MKKVLALLLAIVLIFSLTACGKDKTGEAEEPDKQEKTVASSTEKKEKEPEQPGTPTDGDVSTPTDGGVSTPTEATVSTPTDTSAAESGGAAGIEDNGESDLLDISFGVEIVDGNVEFTVLSEDGDCVTMVFHYEGDTLRKETTHYYVSNMEEALSFAEAQKQDPTVVADSVSIEEADGYFVVSCTMEDSMIEGMRMLSCEELAAILQLSTDIADGAFTTYG